MTEEDRQHQEKTQSMNKKWKIISYLYTFSALGLACYWEFRDVPVALNRYIYDFQVSIFEDSYYPALDVMVTLLVLVIPLMIAKIIIEKTTGVKLQSRRF